MIEADGLNIYIDPYRIRNPEKLPKADLILVTHPHFDHLSPADISGIQTSSTEILVPKDSVSKVKNALGVEPNREYEEKGVKIDTVPAYNIKPERLNFHPKSNKWVGYVLHTSKGTIYHAGDTDKIDEMSSISADLALLPIGGTYTMSVDEAIEASRQIKAKYFAPMHYKALLGNAYKQAEEKFKNEVKNAVVLEQLQEPYFSLQ